MVTGSSRTLEWKVTHLKSLTDKWSGSINFEHDYEWTLVLKKQHITASYGTK
jgi:hypothetical protein